MNGDLLTVMLTIIGTGIALLAASGGLFWKLGNIESDVKALSGIWDHVGANENRLTKIETEHKCCPVCRRNGKGKHE